MTTSYCFIFKFHISSIDWNEISYHNQRNLFNDGLPSWDYVAPYCQNSKLDIETFEELNNAAKLNYAKNILKFKSPIVTLWDSKAILAPFKQKSLFIIPIEFADFLNDIKAETGSVVLSIQDFKPSINILTWTLNPFFQ